MDELEEYTYENLLEEALSRVPDTLDKREGSIIYDALAPACYALAGFYLQLILAYNNVFIDTAMGEYLDMKVAERGLTRNPATYAERRIDCEDADGNPMTINIGDRFSTLSSTDPINYTVDREYRDSGDNVVPGAYICICETAGTAGNSYTGDMAAISNIDGLSSAVLSTLITPAEDEETDDELRARFKASIISASYGGNRSEYVNDWVLPINGVGACQIYPIWNGGGTVKVSITDTSYNPVSNEFISIVKEILDPTDAEGTGVGLVPIGHVVTVVTPTETTVPVTVDIQLRSGYSLADVETAVEEAIQSLIDDLKQNWGEWDSVSLNYNCVLYQSYIISSLLSIEGIVNVSQVLIDGVDDDYTFIQTALAQQLPKLGTVTINV